MQYAPHGVELQWQARERVAGDGAATALLLEKVHGFILPSRDPSLESLEQNRSHQPQQHPQQLEQQQHIASQHQTPTLPSRAIEKVSVRYNTSKLRGGHPWSQKLLALKAVDDALEVVETF
jgi:hypothetical protein